MKKMKLATLFCLGLVLSACAPAVVGSQTLNPVVAPSPLATVHAVPGQTIYVQYTYPRQAFRISDERYSTVLIGTNGNTVHSQESRAYWLGFTAEGLPADWQLSVAEAAVRKEVVSSSQAGDTIGFRYYEQLRVIYRVTLPADAQGSQFALLKFRDGGAEIGTVPLSITVDN